MTQAPTSSRTADEATAPADSSSAGAVHCVVVAAA